jgi:hypothetical protein
VNTFHTLGVLLPALTPGASPYHWDYDLWLRDQEFRFSIVGRQVKGRGFNGFEGYDCSRDLGFGFKVFYLRA